jgi:anti-sigma B factor antagonist
MRVSGGPPMAERSGLRLRTHLAAGGITVVKAHGELDFSTRDQLNDLLLSIEDTGAPVVVLDFTPLEFIDSSGLHVLISAHRRAVTEGWQLRIVCGPGPVYRAFTLSGLTSELSFLSRVPGE